MYTASLGSRDARTVTLQRRTSYSQSVDPETVKQELRSRALDLGFGACGFTTAEQLDCGSILAEWIAQGRHGDMDYLQRQGPKRLLPGASLNGAVSVIVLAVPYPPPPPPDPNWRHNLTGRISAYALGRDYHKEAGRRLDEFADTVASLTGARCHCQVDAGPLVEKELARRAGLGWFGHNTNILSKDGSLRGSYFFLGCLITEAQLPADQPMVEGHCGTCRVCIPACPTGALDDRPTINTPLCISYLTIEHRGPVEMALRPLLGAWVFGCDLCQEACPWNEESAPPCEQLNPPLADLLLLDRDGFQQRYGHTAVARAKRRGLARNAAIALGNTLNPAATTALEEALRCHDEALVRAHAAWALGRLPTTAPRRALVAAQGREHVLPVAREIELALAQPTTRR